MNSSILCAKFTIFSGKGKPISRRLSHPTLRDSRRLNSHAFGIPSFWWVPPHVQYPPHPQNAGVTTARWADIVEVTDQNTSSKYR